MTGRLLAPHEAAITAAGVRLVLHCDVVGELDETVLAEAVVRLRSCYPLIAGRIATDDAERGPAVRIEEGAIAPAVGRGEDFGEEVAAPLHWDQGPLLRLTVLHDPDRPGHSRVVLTLPRAFADAMSYLALHQRLWTLYTALAAGAPVPDETVRPVLGPALDDLLAARFTARQLRDFVAERARLDTEAPPALLPTLASRNGGPGADLSFGILVVEAGADQCVRLVQRARETALTVNALVSGVLLTALRTLFDPSSGPVRILCTTAADMRRRLDPPLPNEVLQSAATTTSIRLQVDHAADPVETGRALDTQLRADLESGAAAMELAAFPHMLDQYPPSLVITNVGSVTEPGLPDGLRITDICLAPLGHVPMVFAVVKRYQGRLAIALNYSRAWYTDTQMQALADQTTLMLKDLTA
ncbi:phthiocerol/phthiodiolone dimycocerosyl transferase family protein [Streptomyces sp. NBC_00388]|uniref:phthiocerol/phthiodiolone dimycocerosyl transferase family protein n=1 Tax=Streptomyces sp. NBC_00388 TaxID=2975735 RepID=UPI002E1B52DB